MRRKSHVRCGAGEKVESGVRMPLRPYLSLLMISPFTEKTTADELSAIVREVNETQVAPEERLTDRAYILCL